MAVESFKALEVSGFFSSRLVFIHASSHFELPLALALPHTQRIIPTKMFSQLCSPDLSCYSSERSPSPPPPIDISRFTNAHSPPSKSGWFWSEDMKVWIPDSLPYCMTFVTSTTRASHLPPLTPEDEEVQTIIRLRALARVSPPSPKPRPMAQPRRKLWWRRRASPRPEIKVLTGIVDICGATYTQMDLRPIKAAQDMERVRRAHLSFFSH
ncbi:hypothetical protein AcV5_008774 [Taiwanofungus camphoratus]|nr:hypothetical protein AcV5_008774 [Antrodia cinnamomea]KAI0956342.1 hypothetical protein AcV7_006770 [Antrodia cinnamomea]